jgi:hypothetical protein
LEDTAVAVVAAWVETGMDAFPNNFKKDGQGGRQAKTGL